MNKKGMLLVTFLVLVIALGVSVAADVDHEHETEHETKTVNGYEIELLTEPESPETGEELHLITHIKSENVSDLHVEIQITKMEMHSGEMEEHIVLGFEEGHAHEEENEPGHYAHHYTFEEEGEYMVRVKIEDVGITDPFHITVAGSFHKDELTMPLIFVAIGIGVAALMIVWTKKGGA